MTTRATRTPRRRTVFALFVIAIVLIAFTVRLVDIQVVSANEYVDASQQATGATRTLYGARGDIVDSAGNVLATSSLTYDAIIDPKNINTIKRYDKDGEVTAEDTWSQMAAKIATILGKTPEDVEGIVSAAVADNKDTHYAKIAGDLPTEKMQQLDALNIPYLGFQSAAARSYPDGAVAGNLLGFMSGDDKPLAGLEMTEDACLEPTNGKESYLYGTNGEMVPGSLKSTPAQNGGTLKLTINRDLQYYLQQMIAEEVQNQGARYGSVMVVETKTGAIRAAAESTTVDPNDVSGSTAREGQIFRYSFEPGSTFKAATAAMIIDAGVATPLSTQSASSWEEFPNGAEIGDSFDHPTYDYTLAGALIDSSNVALSKFGTLLDPQTRHDYLEKYGVGTPTAVDFQGESSGVLPPASGWDNQSYYTTTFGQHFTVTAPQVASFYQAIANGGKKLPLSLVESCTKADGTVVKPKVPAAEQIMKPQTAADVSLMVENVAEQGGVADLIKVPGYRIAAKTGTAQKVDPATGAYKPNLYDTSIVGFAPADHPEYVVIVTLDEPTRVTSSTATAPAFQKAMTQVLKTFRVMPSETPFTQLLPKFG